MAFSPDGKRLASGGSEQVASVKELGEVKVWDAQTGRELLTLKDTGEIDLLALSPDNKHLATASCNDQTVKIWDTETTRGYLTMKATDQPRDYVAALAFSPDGKRLAAGVGNPTYVNEQGKGLPGEVKLWDAENGRELFTLKGHTQSVTSVVFSPDGKRLASGSSDKTVKVWNAETGQEVLTLKGHTSDVYCMAYSPDGQRLASVSGDETVKVWDAQTGQELASLKGYNGYPCCLALSEDGRCMVGTRYDRTVMVKKWDTQKDRGGLTFKVGSGNINNLAYSPDGTRLAVGGDDGPKLSEAQTGKEIVALKGHSAALTRLAFSPDGKRLATSSLDKTVKVWDTQTGQELVTKAHATVPSGVAFSPDGKRLASSSWDGVIKLWDTESWTEVRTMRGEGVIYDVAFTPDGKRLASSSNWLVRIWDPETGRPVRTLRGPFGGYVYRAYRALAISPDGQRVAGGGKPLFIWDAQTGRQLLTLDGHTANVSRLAFSPDGKRLVSGGSDMTVKLWDAETGRELLSFQGGVAGVFSPDGHRLARGTSDGTVEIWDATPLPEKEQKPVQPAAGRQVAEGWWTAGIGMENYEMRLDTAFHHGGRASAFIKSKVPEPIGFANVVQTDFRADDYRGKRLRLSAYVKTENADQGAWLWMRLDCETKWVLDNMHDRPITGTRDWKIYDIVLDVPEDTVSIKFGIALTGAGQAWFDDLQFDIVGRDVPITKSTTDICAYRGSSIDLPAKPVNLDFESERAPSAVPKPSRLTPVRPIAKGWTTGRGSKPDSEMGLDSNVRHGGNRSAFIKSQVREPIGWAMVLQRFRADDYRGKRLRLSGFVKTENADQGAWLWMRLDCKTKRVLDNMHDRLITGTRDWKIHDIVLDVPKDAVNISFGAALTGAGQAWFDDLQFDVVSPDYLTTGSPSEGQPLAWQLEPVSQAKPLNLDFEE